MPLPQILVQLSGEHVVGRLAIVNVAAAVAAWPTYAKNAGLSDRRANEIQSHQIPYAAFNG